MFIRIFLSFIALLLTSGIASAAPVITLNSTSTDINSIREVNITSTSNPNTLLESFAGPVRGFFFSPGASGSE